LYLHPNIFTGEDMTKDEALRLALEALKKARSRIVEAGGSGWKLEAQRCVNAITAIKAALEAKDEPVAWRDAAIRLGEELSSVGPDGYYDLDAKEWLDWAIEQNPRGKHSLPQRIWVGLTDEEWNELYDEYVPLKHYARLMEAIEAKLKEKNYD
jgi:hypothetical protein